MRALITRELNFVTAYVFLLSSLSRIHRCCFQIVERKSLLTYFLVAAYDVAESHLDGDFEA